jgi:hypothetical protein
MNLVAGSTPTQNDTKIRCRFKFDFLTKCECGCTKHNGYDLLKESRSYHANEANDQLEKTSTSRNYELYSKMLKLLVKIMELDDRDQVLAIKS